MSLADDIRTLREKGFVQVAVPGEDDLYEIRVDLLSNDEPAITLDAVEVLLAADPYDARAWKVKSLPCPTCGNMTVMGYLLVKENDEHMHTHYVCTFWRSRTTVRCGWSGYSVPGWDKGEAPS